MQALELESRVLTQWDFVNSPGIPEFPLAEGCKLVHFTNSSELDIFSPSGMKIVNLQIPKIIIDNTLAMSRFTHVNLALVFNPNLIDVVIQPLKDARTALSEARKLRDSGYEILDSNPNSLVVGWKSKSTL